MHDGISFLSAHKTQMFKDAYIKDQQMRRKIFKNFLCISFPSTSAGEKTPFCSFGCYLL